MYETTLAYVEKLAGCKYETVRLLGFIRFSEMWMEKQRDDVALERELCRGMIGEVMFWMHYFFCPEDAFVGRQVLVAAGENIFADEQIPATLVYVSDDRKKMIARASLPHVGEYCFELHGNGRTYLNRDGLKIYPKRIILV